MEVPAGEGAHYVPARDARGVMPGFVSEPFDAIELELKALWGE